MSETTTNSPENPLAIEGFREYVRGIRNLPVVPCFYVFEHQAGALRAAGYGHLLRGVTILKKDQESEAP